MSPKSIHILGITGSVGSSAADVILSAPEKFAVLTVTAHSNVAALAEKARALKARKAVIADESKYKELQEALSGSGIAVAAGAKALEEAVLEPADITLAAIVGMAGLRPVMAALRGSRAVAIANKEPLVAAGPLVLAEAKKHGTKILPVDSEHNAIFQVFDFERPEGIEKIILTASGGPFRTWPLEKITNATVEDALRHPNWSMGRKISVDSATMMNKALEIIEAHYLFNMPPEKIDVLVHPQSIVHSMVSYRDGSVLAQMAASDMRTPLTHVLAWPERMDTPGQRLDWSKIRELTFEKPDPLRFPALETAYDAIRRGPYACIALNAANEAAVDKFLNKNSAFPDIMNVVCGVLDQTAAQPVHSLEDIEELDRSVRSRVADYMIKEKTVKAVLS